MTGEYFCRLRENLHCFYITKDNVKEFVDKYLSKEEHSITMTERFAYVKYKFITWHIRLDALWFMKTMDGLRTQKKNLMRYMK